MSKLCDVKAMYGQDFGITVTNAPSNVIESYVINNGKPLPKNMIIISSEADSEKNDKGIPSIFATDYNGNPLRLTYAIHTSYNGIWPNENGLLELHIDNESIKSNSESGLYVDTNNLTYCSFNNLGVSKIANSITSRSNATYPTDTFIRVDKNGVLYLSDSFITHIYQYVASKIYLNLYPIIMDNIRGWLVDSNSTNIINYYTTDTIPVASIDESGIIIIKHFILNYKSMSSISEEIDFDINNNEYPIKEVILNSKTTSVIKDGQSTTEITIYKHSLDFTIKFYPNYNLQNNIFLDNQYFIKLHPQTFAENKYMVFYFSQNNVFNQNTNNIEWPIQLEAQQINLNILSTGGNLNFKFKNKFRYFEDSDFNIEIFYIKSNNENNTDDAISLINENVNNQLESNEINISLSPDKESYKILKDYLIKVDVIKQDNVITQLGTASNKYKYVLKYSINGERTYTYENVFNVNYVLTNLYYAANYMTISSINIFTPSSTNNDSYNDNNQLFNIISEINNNNIIVNLYTNNNSGNNNINDDIVEINKENVLITLQSNSISKLLSNIVRIPKDNEYQDIIILQMSCNFIKDIYINTNNTAEYSIWDLYTTYSENNLTEPNNLTKGSIYHIHDDKPTFDYTVDYRYIYPDVDTVQANSKSLTILTSINVDELMFQKTNNNRIHSSTSNKIYYNMTIENQHGPTINLRMVFDYAKFFTENIKIFDSSYINYSSPRKDINIEGPQIPESEHGELIEIKLTKDDNNIYYYNNSKFYVGITDNLYKAINLDKMHINFRTYDENHNISSKQVNSRSLSTGIYDRTTYHIYEFDYSALFYTYVNDTDYIYNPQIVDGGFETSVFIDYKWKYSQQNVTGDKNTFEYKLSFTINPNTDDYNNLNDPQIIDQSSN